MHALPPDEEMYRALVLRDPSYDGVFLACVRTTGIFCRPTCRARKPRTENVEYVATATAALHAGYRPCKICRPLGGEEIHPPWVLPLLEPARRVTDRALLRDRIDPARVRRYFKRHFGVTFHAYQRAWRLGTAMTRLSRGDSISGVAYDAGFESESGFREAFAKLFGAPPGRARESDCLRARWMRTPLGPMIAVASAKGIALLEFVDRRALQTELEFLRRHFDAAVVPGRNSHLDLLEEELARYFDGSLEEFMVELDAPGTPFQKLVWGHLRRIPYGETESYASMARSIGRPGASRAVGRANGGNRIAIVVPCHRVIRADGSLCGYGGGLWRKKRLLELERAAVPA